MKLADLLPKSGRPIAYYPELRRIAGSTHAALLLCQLLYWHGKQSNAQGWIHKRVPRLSQDCTPPPHAGEQDLLRETGLTYAELDRARAKLRRRGLVQEIHNRVTHRTHFRLDLDALTASWRDHFPSGRVAAPRLPNRRTTTRESSERDPLSGTYIDYTETTAESPASSVSSEDEMAEMAGTPELPLPATPVEALKHPDIQLFQAVCERLPARRDYAVVIQTMRHFRAHKGPQAADYLRPFWLAWASRRRITDGQPYDPGSITWLTEWAMNGAIPPHMGDTHAKTNENHRRQHRLAEADLAAARAINHRHRSGGSPEVPDVRGTAPLP